MSNESTVLTNLTVYSTDASSVPKQDVYVLPLVLMSVFLGGTLVLLSVILILCRRGCDGNCRYGEASEDPEKTNSYLEEAQPVHEITIRVDESDCLSAASSHDMETERFLSTGTTGRRVSFNEAALFDHSKKTQEKGRRYTLTEGDFHHLKNARLTHLHIPCPALKIVTIHECESSENSIAMTTRPASKSSLSIFQPLACPLPETVLTTLSISPISTLPGDALNSSVDPGFRKSTHTPSPEAPRTGITFGAVPRAGPVIDGVSTTSGQGPMLQFFTKLRRHASLEGVSPYFKIKKWKLDSSQRASSLDTRGSPKRKQFQRQRAASESMDQDNNDSHHIDLIQYIAQTKDMPYHPSPRLLSPPSTPPPSLGRLEVEVVVEPGCSSGAGLIGASSDSDELMGVSCHQESSDHQSLYRDIWTLRASLEQYVSSDQSSNNDKDSVRSDADSVCSLGGRTDKGRLPSFSSQDIGDEPEGDTDQKGKQDSVESERGSDGETGNRKLLQMDSGYASIEAPFRAPEDLRIFGSASGSKDGTAIERRLFFTSSGRKGTVCESFEMSFDEELEEEPGPSTGKEPEGAMTWSPYGQMFTPCSVQSHPLLHRRDYSIDEKTDALFHEFLRHDPQFDQQESPLRSKHRSRVHLRKQWQRSKQYSDPGVRFPSSFDRHRTPLRRGDSVNYPLDIGYHSTLPRIVSAPDEEASEGASSAPQTPKLIQERAEAQDHQKDNGGPSRSSLITADSIAEQHEQTEESRPTAPSQEATDSPPQSLEPGYGPQTITAELTDKLAANLEERLYTSLRRTKDSPECVVTVAHTSPDHSPV
ncbi:voltage-dependent calcium channel beta subunit-associated regulatory protein [Denticeps clupeoides]|uniref:Uncharacterized protein n=1 Tax=Denticeps clupeoides TaxID=299321 RepID=A0AAY4CAI2_9TELE|nr:voltage-dependent calcium channel beta subunit-associated regulatory protein [Denticeps clupeoides]XP_028857108.1 voltage-dependent calcium channel beta subunit-associated regulatory protein [Denticeps clupeoides]